MKTTKDVTVVTQRGPIPYEIIVPKGTPVRSAGYNLPDGTKAYWAENLASFLRPGSIQMHDATHYGLVISGSDVEAS